MQDDDFDYDDRDDDPCDHEDHDVDVLSGRCHCWRCGESWYATGAEVDAQLRWEAEYHELVEREERRQWWRDLFAPALDPIRSVQRRVRDWRDRRKFPEHAHDDIPF